MTAPTQPDLSAAAGDEELARLFEDCLRAERALRDLSPQLAAASRMSDSRAQAVRARIMRRIAQRD